MTYTVKKTLLLFFVSIFSLYVLTAQNQNKTSLPRNSYYSLAELRDAFNGGGQIAFATLFNKPSNRTKSITPKYIHNDSLLIVLNELTGGGESSPQSLSLEGSTLSLSDGGGSVTLPVPTCKTYISRLFVSNNGSPFFFNSVRQNNTGSTFTFTRVSAGYYQLNWNGDSNIDFDAKVSVLSSARTRNKNIYVFPASGNIDIYLTDNSDNLIDQGQFDICIYMCE